MGRDIDVVAVGTLNIDFMILGDAPLEAEKLLQWVGPVDVKMTPAGSVGYCAVDMARLGLKVSLLSSVADDMFGEYILKELEKNGVFTDAIRVEKNSMSGIGIYMLLFGDRKRPLAARLGSHHPWPVKPGEKQIEHLKKARLLHCSGYLHYSEMWGAPTEELYATAKELGLITSMDPQFPFEDVDGAWMKCFGDVLGMIDWLFTDEHEAKSITGASSLEAAAGELLAAGPDIVVVKQGARGAMVATGDEIIFQSAEPVEEMVDSIGAGDAFDAAFICGMLGGMSIKRTARFASVAAALSLGGVGGIETAPTLEEVESGI